MKQCAIIPTVVPNSLDDLVRVRDQYPFANTIHLDVADGVFAPNTTWMPRAGDQLPEGVSWEIHLMVEKPTEIGLTYLTAGASSLIGHVEAFRSAENAATAFSAWKDAGAAAVAAAALLQTPLDVISPYVSKADWILMMTIASIGTQGIPFDESGIERVAALKNMHPTATIGVDGGVSLSNVEKLAKAGATRFCAGSVISKSNDYEATYNQILSLASGV